MRWISGLAQWSCYFNVFLHSVFICCFQVIFKGGQPPFPSTIIFVTLLKRVRLLHKQNFWSTVVYPLLDIIHKAYVKGFSSFKSVRFVTFSNNSSLQFIPIVLILLVWRICLASLAVRESSGLAGVAMLGRSFVGSVILLPIPKIYYLVTYYNPQHGACRTFLVLSHLQEPSTFCI